MKFKNQKIFIKLVFFSAVFQNLTIKGYSNLINEIKSKNTIFTYILSKY